MERLISSPRTEISLENGISWKVDQNSQREFPNGKSAFHLLVFSSPRPFGLDRLWSYLPRKSLGNGTSASPWKFSVRIRRVPFTKTVNQPVFPSKGKQPCLRPRFKPGPLESSVQGASHFATVPPMQDNRRNKTAFRSVEGALIPIIYLTCVVSFLHRWVPANISNWNWPPDSLSHWLMSTFVSAMSIVVIPLQREISQTTD